MALSNGRQSRRRPRVLARNDLRAVEQRPSLRARRADGAGALARLVVLALRPSRVLLCDPTVAYGRVFLGNADGYVYSFGAKSGKLIWAQHAGTYVYTAAAVWRRTVYVGTWDGYVVAFDAATGKTRWRHDSPGGVSGAPTVMDGLLYYSTLGLFKQGAHQRRVEPGANETFALDARTGKRVWRFPDGAYSPIVADRDRVYLVGKTRVYGLEEQRTR